MAGWLGGWQDKLRIRLNSASVGVEVEVEVEAELGNKFELKIQDENVGDK